MLLNVQISHNTACRGLYVVTYIVKW